MDYDDDYDDYVKKYKDTTYDDQLRELMVNEYDLVYFLLNPFILSDIVVI